MSLQSAGQAMNQRAESLPQKIQSLNDIKRRIDQLQIQLVNLEEERDRIQAEIAEINPSTANITRVPLEILSLILANVIEFDASGGYSYPRKFINDEAKTLMLVCKRWKDTILDTPQIWSQISLSAPTQDGEDGFTWIKNQIQYVTRFLSRSKAVPVDVDLEFGCLMDGYEAIDQRIHQAFWDFKNQKEAYYTFFSGWDCGGRDLCEERYDNLFARLMEKIVGPEGASIRRWRSLKLILPSGETQIEAIWSIISHNAPRLKKVEIEAEYHVVPNQTQCRGLVWPSVTQLDLRYNVTLEHVPVCPNLLKLDLVPQSWRGIGLIGQFLHLRDLRIHPCDEMDQLPSIQELHLPQIQNISLTTRVPVQLLQALRPGGQIHFVLKEASNSAYGCGAPIPAANVFNVTRSMTYLTVDPPWHRWDFGTPPVGPASRSEQREKERHFASYGPTFRSLFSQLLVAQTISVTEYIVPTVIERVHECHLRSGLPLLEIIAGVDCWCKVQSSHVIAT